MVVNQPMRGKLDSQRNGFGAIRASYEHGCPKNQLNNNDRSNSFWDMKKNLAGYTVIDWIEKESTGYEDIKDEFDEKNPTKTHVYKEKDVKNMVEKKILDNKIIKKHRIRFKKERCLKCGIVGDSRFMDNVQCKDPRISIFTVK